QASSFARRIVGSGGFDGLYREGIGVIEAVASYLDEPGRVDSRVLPRRASVRDGAETMRRATKLMDLASLARLPRTVNEGEISRENARSEKEKVKFSATPSERGGPGYDHLPVTLRDFIDKGDRLFDRVMQLDALERGAMPTVTEANANGVADQLAR